MFFDFNFSCFFSTYICISVHIIQDYRSPKEWSSISVLVTQFTPHRQPMFVIFIYSFWDILCRYHPTLYPEGNHTQFCTLHFSPSISWWFFHINSQRTCLFLFLFWVHSILLYIFIIIYSASSLLTNMYLQT